MKQWLPSLLEERGWTCAAAVELTEGVRVIEKHLNILPNGCMSTEQQKGFKEILPHVTQLRHTAVHRRLLASDQLQEQVHCAYVLAEVLQDNECRDKLQIIRRSVDGGVKDMKKQTEEMKQELERRLKQLELTLQTTIAQQQSSISLAAGQKLVDSINKELRPCYPSAAAEIKGTFTCDEHARNTGDIILVDENDIESDEDRLQTEL
jgi:Sec-independent protein translocase protein TatA